MKHILVVDDDASVCDMLSVVLTTKGYQVSKAADGVAAVAIVEGGGVDLVVTDLLMPRKEGIETIMELRAISPSLKIIAISGGLPGDSGHLLKMASCLGADRVLHKPFPMATFVKEILELLEGDLSQPSTSP